MNVIGLTGLAGSGKTTVANYLVEKHGYTRLSFDGPLKAMLRTLDPILGHGQYGGDGPLQDVRLSDLIEDMMTEDDIEESEYGTEYRRLLECIGAHEAGYWIRAAMAQMLDEDGLYVFDGVQTHDQADAIKAYNPWGLWRIDRPAPEDSEPAVRWLGEVQTLFNVTTPEFLCSEADRALRLAFSDTAPLAQAS